MNTITPEVAKKKRSMLKRIFSWLLIISLIGCLALTAAYFHLNSKLPDVSALKDVHLQVPMRVLDSSGGLIAQYGEKRRIPVAFDDIPPALIDAILATEDARFYEHPGVDIIGIARAAVAVIKSGKKKQGASTITMQVARNFYLTREKTISRKITEVLLALKIDRNLSKKKILSLYLNKIFFGNRAYGVGAAAAVYYGEPLKDLTLPQLAMLAGLPQSPSRNNPIRNPKAAFVRRNHVLERMLSLKKITQQQYETAIAQPVTAKYHHKKSDLHAPYVAALIRNEMHEKYGDAIYDMGLTVRTTITASAQRDANNALQNGLINYSIRHGYWGAEGHTNDLMDIHTADLFKPYISIPALPLGLVLSVADRSVSILTKGEKVITIPWKGLKWARKHLDKKKVSARPHSARDILTPGDIVRYQNDHNLIRLAQVPHVQGALISVDPVTGNIKAMVGGFSYEQSVFNRVTQALRQPGSLFKPFIYSAGLAHDFTLASIINDAPIVIKDSGENRYWRPMNDSKRFYGPTTLRIGLAKSRNLVSIRLLQQVGIQPTLQYLKKFGFNPANLPHSLSLSLGAGELTPEAIAQAYTILANGGYFRKNTLIESILIANTPPTFINSLPNCPAHTDLVTQASDCAPSVITAQNDYLMTKALQGVVQSGTARALKTLHRSDLAAKTGTTNDQLDAWFAGYNAKLLTVVWVGYDDLSGLHEYGSQAALPIWKQFMTKELRNIPNPSLLPAPTGIIQVRINKKTGLPASASDPHSFFESFREANAPTINDQASGTHENDTDTTEQPAHDYHDADDSESIF